MNGKILLQRENQLIVSTKKRWWHVRFLPSCTSVICHTLTKSKNCSRLNFWIYTSFVQVHDRAHDLPRHFQTKKGFLSPPYSTLNSNSHLAIEKNKWKIFWKWMLKFKRKLGSNQSTWKHAERKKTQKQKRLSTIISRVFVIPLKSLTINSIH